MNDWAINESGPLTKAEILGNAAIVRDYFAEDWSAEAVSALLANMEVESGINPARWENDNIGNLVGGFGLVQWTPATKLFDWIDEEHPGESYDNGNIQLARISYELENGLQYSPTKPFKETFQEWVMSEKPPGYLAAAFLCNYERAKNTGIGAQLSRAKLAEKWYTTITGNTPKRWIPPALIILMKRSDYN